MSVGDGECKSNNWLYQWQCENVGKGSWVQSFLRTVRSSNDVLVLLLNQPNTTSRLGIRQLAISFDSIFLRFFFESSWGPCLWWGKSPAPALNDTSTSASKMRELLAQRTSLNLSCFRALLWSHKHWAAGALSTEHQRDLQRARLTSYYFNIYPANCLDK